MNNQNPLQKIQLIEKNQNLMWKILLTNFCILIPFWMTWVFSFHLAIDDYNAYYNGIAVANFCVYDVYRLTYGILYRLICNLNVNPVVHQSFFGFVLLLTMVVVTTAITMEILGYFKSESVNDNTTWLLVDAGAIFLFANVFVGEWLYFTHTYLAWTFAIIGAVYGAIFIGEGGKKRPLGFLMLLILVGSYQVGVPIYVFIVMTLIYLKHEGKISIKAILDIVQAASLLVLALIINSLLVFVYARVNNLPSSNRVKISLDGLLNNLKDLLAWQKEIWVRGMGLLPSGSLLIVLLLLGGILVYLLYRSKPTVTKVGYVILTLISGLCTLYLIISTQSTLWIAARIIAPIFGFFSCLIWMISFHLNCSKVHKKKQVHRIALVVCICAIMGNYFCTQRELQDIMIANATEKSYADRVNRKIAEYESTSGCLITRVGFVNDQVVTWKHSPLLYTGTYSGELAENAFVPPWSQLYVLNYYTGRTFGKLETEEIPDDILSYIENTNWDVENLEEQLIFSDDKLYIALY